MKQYLLFLLILTISTGHAQNLSIEEKKILQLDSAFWKAYNSCDTTAMEQFLTSDLEFYHDKGGPSYGRDNLMETTKRNLCSNSGFRLRREEVKGTVKSFPLTKNGNIYGVILLGEHVFYIREKGSETLDGRASFTHLWLKEEGKWKMARVLSYDHGPANKPLNE